MEHQNYENIFKLWEVNTQISLSSGLEKEYEKEENEAESI